MAKPADLTAEQLARCCGSKRWVERMLASQPFADAAALLQAADDVWSSLEPAAWLEAFSHHPKIGGKDALREKFAATRTWAQGEQAGVKQADEAVLEALARGNAEYEARFHHIFIVCATGKTAAEMLALLRARLPNTLEEELRIAAAEQAKITRLRLEKLLSQGES
jgi:2-oxo-4-hydroxy-4-carboxy-5-ureidoimidazoline decarboxylase